MRTNKAPRFFVILALAMAMAVPFGAAIPTRAFFQLSGAIFTTESVCDGTNINIFSSKEAVYLDGGPVKEGSAGLPDGEYYVQVTEPNGTLLGTSVGTTDETPVVVVDGEFVTCYQLWAILRKASNAGPYPVAPDGYDTTTNGGGEYKVWVSMVSTFDNNQSKTDNFKVEISDTQPPQGTLNVIKFYDANADGVHDPGEVEINGWKIGIEDGISLIRFTPVLIILDPDDYTISEFTPNEPNWIRTTPSPVLVTIEDGDNDTVEFGNVCLGGGGGHTLGFWSNKNGKATMNDGGTLCPELTLLNNLCLRNAAGADTSFLCNYDNFRSWLLSASATNMAYMLSAQLAAMELNVEAGFVDGDALVYAPGTNSANGLGFATIGDLLDEAEAELCANGLTLAGHPSRSYQEALKNALDKANNNQNFVQGEPCPFSFPETQ